MGRKKGALWKADMIRALCTKKVLFSIAAMALFYGIAELQEKSWEDVCSIHSDVSISSFSVLAYVICAVPYVTGFCEDIEHRYIYQVLVRVKKWKYVLSKLTAIFISAFFTFFGGNILFLFLESLHYPLVDTTSSCYQYPLGGEELASLLHSGQYAAYFGICIFAWALLGGLLSVLAAYISLYLKNKIAVICTPMVVYYFGINFMEKYLGLSRRYNPMCVYDMFNNIMGSTTKSVLYAAGYTVTALVILFMLCLYKIGRDYS